MNQPNRAIIPPQRYLGAHGRGPDFFARPTRFAKIVLWRPVWRRFFNMLMNTCKFICRGWACLWRFLASFMPVIWAGRLGFAVWLTASKRSNRPRWLFVGLLGGFALFLLWAAALRSLWGLLPLFLALACVWLSQPLTTGYLHHRTPSSHRATVESFAHLLTSLLAVGVGLAFGQITTRWDIFSGYRFLAVVLLGFALYWGIASRGLPAYAAIEAEV